jgi:hypothetical protein
MANGKEEFQWLHHYAREVHWNCLNSGLMVTEQDTEIAQLLISNEHTDMIISLEISWARSDSH